MNSIRQYLSAPAHRQRGFSMVEILVALMISVFLIAGVIQLFLGSKQTYRFHDALSRLQENGRLALDTMARDIRMAGFDMANWIPPSPSPDPVKGTDNSINLAWADNGNQTRNYSIAPSTSTPTCPAAGNSLRLNSNDGGPQELIEGVQAMQILYGSCNTDPDNNGKNDSVTTPPGYVNAATITANNQWRNVCSVRIHLLMVSLENNVVTQPQAYFFPMSNTVSQTPTDRCLRQVFSTTITIRNRIP